VVSTGDYKKSRNIKPTLVLYNILRIELATVVEMHKKRIVNNAANSRASTSLVAKLNVIH